MLEKRQRNYQESPAMLSEPITGGLNDDFVACWDFYETARERDTNGTVIPQWLKG